MHEGPLRRILIAMSVPPDTPLHPPTQPSPTVQPQANPVAASERLVTLDVLRGVALLGILVVNMLYFSGPLMTTPPLGYWTAPADRAAEWGIRVFAEGAFYSIFSFLFGLGVALQLTRGDPDTVTPHFRRRLGVLLVIGLVHLFFVWSGDILVTYAVAGFFLIPLRSCKTRTVFVWAAALLAVTIAGYVLFIDPLGNTAMNDALTRVSLTTFRDGSYTDILPVQLSFSLAQLLALPISVPNVLWLFLVGLVAGRLGIFDNIAGHTPLIRRVVVGALVVALISKGAYGALLATGRASQTLSFVVGGPALGCVYAGLLSLLLRAQRWQRWLAPVASVGRMALSNYLAQSVFALFFFYGYGLRFFGQLGPATTLVFSLLLYATQVVLSHAWLRVFRFGPVEWVWRTLTYGRVQPMR